MTKRHDDIITEIQTPIKPDTQPFYKFNPISKPIEPVSYSPLSTVLSTVHYFRIVSVTLILYTRSPMIICLTSISPNLHTLLTDQPKTTPNIPTQRLQTQNHPTPKYLMSKLQTVVKYLLPSHQTPSHQSMTSKYSFITLAIPIINKYVANCWNYMYERECHAVVVAIWVY